MAVEPQINFNAGELSEFLDPRIDIEKYGNGCRQLQNFQILTYGAAQRRKGTQFVKEVKTSAKATRVIPFKYSVTTTYVIELGDLYMRFYVGGSSYGRVESGGSPVTVVTPYTEDEIFDVQFAQIRDLMYFVHPSHPVYKLTRTSATSFTFAAVVFDSPAFLEENATSTTVYCSHTTGTDRTLTASSAIFYTGHVGSYFKVSHLNPGQSTTCSIFGTSGTTTSTAVRIKGDWTLTTSQRWYGTVYVERSDTGAFGGEEDIVQEFERSSDGNVAATGTEPEWVYMRIRYVATGDPYGAAVWAGTPPVDYVKARAVLESSEQFFDGIVKITAVSGDGVTTATVDVVDEVFAAGSTNTTKYWAFDAWSDYEGYPRTVTAHQTRLVFGGTTKRPNYFWGSNVDDFENFARGIEDDDAWMYAIADVELNQIQWMSSQESLLIGTSSAEFSVGGDYTGSPVTPTAIDIKRQSTFGSAYTKAQLANDVVLFIERQKKRVRELAFNVQQGELGKYVANDLTLLANHISAAGIVDVAYQQQPNNIYWIATGDGNFSGLTYERSQNVVGWHRHVTDGDVESLAVIYGDDDDELWMIVKREKDGSDVRYVERIIPDNWTTIADAWYVDSGLSWSGGGVSPATITSVTDGTPVVLHFASHGFSDGQQARITGTDNVELDGLVITVRGSTSTTINCYDETNTFPITISGASVTSGTLTRVENTLTGFDHLEGKTLIANIDGTTQTASGVVASGTVTFPKFGASIIAGLAYESILEPMYLQRSANGSVNLLRKVKVGTVQLRIKDSSEGFLVSDGVNTEQVVTVRDLDDAMDTAANLKSGVTGKIDIESEPVYDARRVISRSDALPLTVLSMTVKTEIGS